MREELLKGLTPEQIAKVKACKNSDEILALAKAEGVQLSDEQLEAVSGGCGGGILKVKCSGCGSDDVSAIGPKKGISQTYICNKCNKKFEV